MRTALRLALAAVFAASAVLKGVDFDATAALVSSLVEMGDVPARAAVAALVLGEGVLAGVVALSLGGERRALAAATLAMIGFLALGVWMIGAGVENCGCFGSVLPMGPVETTIKNVVLLALSAGLWRTAPRAG